MTETPQTRLLTTYYITAAVLSEEGGLTGQRRAHTNKQQPGSGRAAAAVSLPVASVSQSWANLPYSKTLPNWVSGRDTRAKSVIASRCWNGSPLGTKLRLLWIHFMAKIPSHAPPVPGRSLSVPGEGSSCQREAMFPRPTNCSQHAPRAQKKSCQKCHELILVTTGKTYFNHTKTIVFLKQYILLFYETKDTKCTTFMRFLQSSVSPALLWNKLFALSKFRVPYFKQ